MAQTSDQSNLSLEPVAFVMDADGEIVDWSPAAEALFGWTRADAIGQRLSALMIPAHQREAHEQGLKYFLSSGKGKLLGRLLKLTVVHRDGHEFEAEFHIGSEQQGSTYRFPARTRLATADAAN
jgi:sigma-B regulation protein RsbU (phosphoserine phosphatase)